MPLILGHIPRPRQRPRQRHAPVSVLLHAHRALHVEGMCTHHVVQLARAQAFSQSLAASLARALCVEGELGSAALLKGHFPGLYPPCSRCWRQGSGRAHSTADLAEVTQGEGLAPLPLATPARSKV